MNPSQGAETTPIGQLNDADWQAPPRKSHGDWIKAALVAGLGILSWVATYVGMLELIEANMGELPLAHRIIIGFSVAMLMLMVIWLLDQMFARHNVVVKTLYVTGYLFLTLISVGFGFGFYWKVLESRSEASRSAESAVGQVQGSLTAAATRLEQLQGTLVSLTAISNTKSEQERLNGTSCPGSKPGSGPRRQMREDDASRFTFASDFVKGRIGAVKEEMSAFESDIAKISSNDASLIDKSGTRNEFMRGLSRKLDTAVTRFNAFRTDPQLKQIRNDLGDRAAKVQFQDTKGGTYTCPDPQLSAALTGVVKAIDGLPELEKPKIAVVEGSEAVIEAFRRLFTTLGGVATFKLPPSPEELRAMQLKAVQSVDNAAAGQRTTAVEAAGLGKRDYIPLFIAIFVDFCLFLVSIGRPMNCFVSVKQNMLQAQQGPVYQILERFHDVHGDRDLKRQFELFSHVIYDVGGHYFAAVPLSLPDGASEDTKREAIMLTNMFAALEQQGVFHRNRYGLRAEWLVKRKLTKQNSKFKDAGAFRVYQFARGAWSEMILGATMAAAKREEARLMEAKQAERDAQADALRFERESRKEAAEAEREEARAERTMNAIERSQRRKARLAEAGVPETTLAAAEIPSATTVARPQLPANDISTYRPPADIELPEPSKRVSPLHRAQLRNARKRFEERTETAARDGLAQEISLPQHQTQAAARPAASYPSQFGGQQMAHRQEIDAGAATGTTRPAQPFVDNVIKLPERSTQQMPNGGADPLGPSVAQAGDIGGGQSEPRIVLEERRISIPVGEADAMLPETLKSALASLATVEPTLPKQIEAEVLPQPAAAPEAETPPAAAPAPWVGELSRALTSDPISTHQVDREIDTTIAARFAPSSLKPNGPA